MPKLPRPSEFNKLVAESVMVGTASGFVAFGTDTNRGDFVHSLPAGSLDAAASMAEIMFRTSKSTHSFGVAEAHMTLHNHRRLK